MVLPRRARHNERGQMNVALSLVIGYLLGSIPFAYLMSRLKGVKDIRNVGDGNAGAFNVLRHAGLAAGLATLFLDIGKGALAVIVAKALHVSELVVFLTGIMAVLGHNLPVFLRFKGGRGVGAIVGILFVLVPWQVAITFALAVIVVFTTKNSIWTSMVLFIPLPFICLLSYWLLNDPRLSMVIYSAFLPCFSGVTHWLTTRRLSREAKKESGKFWIAGTEDPRG